MAFDSLGEKLQGIFKSLRGRGKLTEKEIKAAMREVKLALLEADVNFKVVKDFIARVSELSVGQEILDSLTPGQQIIKIVRDELTALMGSEHEALTYAKQPPTVYMLCGLQGAGKTTACGKLALNLRKTQGKRPLMVTCLTDNAAPPRVSPSNFDRITPEISSCLLKCSATLTAS